MMEVSMSVVPLQPLDQCPQIVSQNGMALGLLLDPV